MRGGPVIRIRTGHNNIEEEKDKHKKNKKNRKKTKDKYEEEAY